MADTVSIFGRKPAMPDAGYGEMYAGRSVATVMGTVTKHARIVRLGGRMGRNTSSNSTVQIGAYKTSGGAPSTRIARTASFVVSTYMADHWSGSDRVEPVESYAKVNAGTELALGLSASSASVAYGMGDWGTMYYEDYVSPLPATFSSDNTRPEGRLSFWAELVFNRAPKLPGIVSPTHNSLVVDLTPTLKCTFDDDDITLDQLPGDTCDFLTKYQFEIWTANASGGKVSRIHNTGVLNATQAQKDAKAAEFTPGSNLSAGKYVATCTFWDEFGEPSPKREWVFTVVSGGALENMDLRSDMYIQPGLVNNTTVVVKADWKSQGGADATTVHSTIRRSSGTLVDGPRSMTFGTAAGSEVVSWIHNFGHPALTPGLSYYVEWSVTDSTGQVSPTARTPDFRVKGAPPVPSLKSPDHSAGFVDPPTLVGTMGEDDGSSVVNPEFGIRPDGTSTYTLIDHTRTYYVDGDYYLVLGTSDLPTKTKWHWSMRAKDAFGDTSAWATEREFYYLNPPTVTVSGVTEGSTIQTSKPNITLSSSSSFVAYRYAIFNTTTQKMVYSSGRKSVSATSSTTFSIEDNLQNTHGYQITFYVETTQGIIGEKSVSFTVDYPAPSSVASVQTTVVPGPFESVHEPRWWSRIRVTWSSVPSGTAPDANFHGYVLERRSLATGEIDLRRVFRSRSQTMFLDVTPRSGVQYEYTVYWIRKPDGVNFVASNPVTVQNGVELKGATISSLSDDNLGAVLHAFSERRAEWGSADSVTVHETWGELPIAFQSLNRGDVISGTFIPMDDERGQFTNMDIVAAIKSMSRVIVDDDGVPRPQAVYYRDGRGRAGAFVISGPSGESDRAWINANEISLTLTEVRVSMVESGP